MSDDLFSIKNEFYLGNYMGAINEAQSGDLELSTPNDERDRDVIVRAQLPTLPSPPQPHLSSNRQKCLQAHSLKETDICMSQCLVHVYI
jgi:hypothetical protein